MAKDNQKQVLFKVPEKDQDILEWLKNQGNMSQSIRKLIRSYVQVYGTGDLNELPITTEWLGTPNTTSRKRGRPRKSETTYASQTYENPSFPPNAPNTRNADYTEQVEVQNTQPLEANIETVQAQNTVQPQVPVQMQEPQPVTEATLAPKQENENDVQYGVEINTNFSGSFAHNEVTTSDQQPKAQPEEQNSSSGITKVMKDDLMNMFNGSN